MNAPELCTSDRQCPPNNTCYKSNCIAACSGQGDCLSDEICKNQRCLPHGERCLPTDRRCSELQPQVCGADARWSNDGEACAIACKGGGCFIPNSCRDLPTCGAADDSCCANDPVPGGDFNLTYEVRTDVADIMTVPRTVRPFTLDRFEVTVSRFYLFLTAFDTARSPAEESGGQPGYPDSGWRREWDENPVFVPPSADSLEKGITSCGSWRGVDDGSLPMHCVNWFVAMAFCIWDGGRLPTEAEWAFAAMAGNDHRAYPWSSNSDDKQIGQERACYWDDAHDWTDRQDVGTRPAGAGAYGHQDLAGNVSEWTADGYQSVLNQDDCRAETSERPLDDCKTQQVTSTRVQRGGAYVSFDDELLNTFRTNDVPERRDATVGFRCARDWN